MAMILTAAPAVEPVSLDEAKAHLRIDGSDEDTLVASLITAARIHVEASLARALITQSWTMVLDAWPDDRVVRLPLSPLQSVDEVRVLDAAGDPTVVPATDYFVDAVGSPPRLVRQSGALWLAPGQVANGIEIDFTAGHGNAAADVPPPLRQSIVQLVAHWFGTREPVIVGEPITVVPLGIGALIAPYRGARL